MMIRSTWIYIVHACYTVIRMYNTYYKYIYIYVYLFTHKLYTYIHVNIFIYVGMYSHTYRYIHMYINVLLRMYICYPTPLYTICINHPHFRNLWIWKIILVESRFPRYPLKTVKKAALLKEIYKIWRSKFKKLLRSPKKYLLQFLSDFFWSNLDLPDGCISCDGACGVESESWITPWRSGEVRCWQMVTKKQLIWRICQFRNWGIDM